MMDSNKKAALLADVKRALKITWENKNTEEELSGMIADAEYYLNHLLGAEIDFSAPGMFHKLFLNYALYAYNHCENEFETAYLQDILKCQAYIFVKGGKSDAENEAAGTE